MSLKAKITEDMKAALRAKDARRLGGVRLLLAAVKQREIDERAELDDSAVLAVIEKMIKQRRESVAQFDKAGRADLADAEQFEISVLQAYMPAALSEDEIAAHIVAALAATSAASMADMGRVMADLKLRIGGRADMAKISAVVRAKLSS